jgi:hypothetical protein
MKLLRDPCASSPFNNPARESHRPQSPCLWAPNSDAIEMLRERKDVGRALDYEDE